MLKNMLLVDDDDIATFITRKVMENEGLVENTITAASAIEALSFLQAQHEATINCFEATRPDLIVVDLQMPMMDGFEFISLIRSELSPFLEGVKVVVLTSFVTLDDQIKAAALSADAYLQKPLTEEKARNLFELCA